MTTARSRSRGALLCVLCIALASLAAACGEAPKPARDPLAGEIARWSAFLRDNPAKDEMWVQVKQASAPPLARAAADLKAGRRLLALQRLAAARVNLAAAGYLRARPAAQHREAAAFEAEWARMGGVLRGDLGSPAPAALDGVRPAAVRALGEAALPQVRAFYQASLEYGRSTTPEAGLFYLGNAQAQRELVALCRSLGEPAAGRAPPVRAIGPELDALEAEMLAAYRPPASIDRHGEFIAASSILKESRELEAAGLRYGALLRYLQAAQRFAPLRPASPPPAASALDERLRDLDRRLSAGGVDHSLGRLFLEAAQAAREPQPPSAGTVAGPAARDTAMIPVIVAFDVLPRYFAALAPARPQAPRPKAQVAVTLVRWPYT